VRRYIILLLVAGAIYWIVKEHATVGSLIDRVTQPVFGLKAAVQESERTRVIDEAAPASEDQNPRVGMLQEGMSMSDVEQLVGSPSTKTPFVEDGKRRVRWTYPKLKRVLVFEENRVISIAIQ
jgi:hypothetical protein